MDSRTLRLLDYFQLLDRFQQYACSEPGARACARMYPLDDADRLAAESKLLAEALEAGPELTGAVTSFPELGGVFSALEQETVLDEDGLWGVHALLWAAEQARRAFGRLSEDRFPILRARAEAAAWPERTWTALNRCLDPEGGLRDESSPDLLAVRQEVRRIHNQCTRKITEYLRREKIEPYLQDEYLTISADRYVLAIQANFKGRMQGIIHDYSQTGETCYFEPMLLVELNNTLQELRQEEREAVRQVLGSLTMTVGREVRAIRSVFDWMVQMDGLRAKVLLARDLNGRCIELGEEHPLFLSQARHPLLVLDHEEVRPVDIELKPEQRGLIISGGNSGGKTVCLKTLGLISLMAMAALPLPVQAGSTLPLWRRIFVFIGDEQNLQEHQSTFTAQIDHFRTEWPKMDASSLILLDEFGAGTDPSQGAALAQAVMDGLLDASAWVVAATHFPALKAYGLTRDNVRAATVLFDPQTNMPLYTLGYDQVGGSRALDVARERGLPQEILSRAEEYLLLDGKDSGQLMSRLNELAVARERELEELRKDRQALKKEQERVKAKLEDQTAKLLEEVQKHSREVVAQWKAGKRQRKQALKELAADKNRLRDHLAKAQGKGHTSQDRSLQIGDHVSYPAWGRKGAVTDKDAKKNRAKVDLGGVTVWVPESELVFLPGEGAPARSTGGYTGSSGRPKTGGRLDLRGMRAEEAVAFLQQHIDQAVLNGTAEVEVIHGRGTGVLRRAVHEELARMPEVGEYFLANEEQGGDGVTIVRL
ncbi:endonuclease MutS2 [Desulfovermiculus halophilus]|jgi:DNA mismatch repair protein MutS2|uniref:endonuclease MutS2 n=1 Tax=Desulfovermiculus halophilus TaxID=339722 RepID=UPI000489B5CA|nr:Smr/MutS family protein [Desulfovermiculus halophilus]